MDRIEREIREVLKDSDRALTQRELIEETGYSRPSIKERTDSMTSNGDIEIREVGSLKLHKLSEES